MKEKCPVSHPLSPRSKDPRSFPDDSPSQLSLGPSIHSSSGMRAGGAGEVLRRDPWLPRSGVRALSGGDSELLEAPSVFKAGMRKCTPGPLPEVPEPHCRPVS